jgi:5-methylcytosine-specific restriction endonuclease McrA
MLTRDDLRARRLGRDPNAVAYAEVLRHDPCSYCGRAGGTIDHIDPVVHGGTNDWGNLTAACTSCNPAKGPRTLLEHLCQSR